MAVIEGPEELQELRHEGDPIYFKALWVAYVLAFLYLIMIFWKS